MSDIKAIRMPKWGLAMEEGTIVEWLKEVGDSIVEGEEIVEIETTKITNVLEAVEAGTLRRIVFPADEVVPVGALIGVLADSEISDADVDAFVEQQSSVVVVDDEDGEEAEQSIAIIQVGDRGINVATTGEGDPIVLLHGYSGDLNNWMLLTDELKPQGKVISIDLPGHGASSKDVGDGTLATISKIVEETLDVLGVENAKVIGHSYGAAVAMQLALSAPDKVKSLALVCPVGLPGTEVSDTFLAGVLEAERTRDVKKALLLLFKDPDLVSRDMVEGVARYLRLDGARSALGLIREDMLNGDAVSQLQGQLDKLPPAVVVASEHDSIVGQPDEAKLPASWKVHWAEEAGHMPHLETSAQVVAAINSASNDH